MVNGQGRGAIAVTIIAVFQEAAALNACYVGACCGPGLGRAPGEEGAVRNAVPIIQTETGILAGMKGQNSSRRDQGGKGLTEEVQGDFLKEVAFELGLYLGARLPTGKAELEGLEGDLGKVYVEEGREALNSVLWEEGCWGPLCDMG